MKHLMFYFVYVCIVLGAGAKFGAFDKLFRHSVMGTASRVATGIAAPTSPDQLPPLRPGTLVFDVEMKQSTVHEGEDLAKFVFSLTNISKQAVVINQVKTSCGCTVAQLPQMPWVLPPDSSGQIPVAMNVVGHTGKDRKTVTIITDQGSKVLNVEADILPPPSSGKMGDRERNVEMSKVDRQAAFKGDCARCHAEPTAGKMGQELYAVACAICHEANPRSTMVPDLHALKHPTNHDFWKVTISNGKPGTLMPAFALAHDLDLCCHRNDRELAAALGISPGRISQIRKSLLIRENTQDHCQH